MNCPKCGSKEVAMELRMGADGGPAGMRPRCLDCAEQWEIAKFDPAKPQSPQALPVQQKARRTTVAPVRLSTRSIITEAKRELRTLDAEIARLRKLEPRRAELARLLDAANGAPGQVVSLKRANNTR